MRCSIRGSVLADVIPERPAGTTGPVVVPMDIDALTPDALGLEERRRSPGQLARRRFFRHKVAIGSLFLLLLIAGACALAPALAPRGYRAQNLIHTIESPGRAWIFGTDTLGRDQFARVLYGGRVSLAVGVVVALVAGSIGSVVGALAGYYGGRLDNLLMRITDLFLSVPLLVVLIVMSKALGGGSIASVIFILSVFFWMGVARIVRGLFLSLKEKEFVEAARASGATDARIIFRHMLPNCFGPIIVTVTLLVTQAILTESLLSFLGFGIQPPVPTWGNMLDDGRSLMTVAPWLVWFPGIAILLTVLCVNFLGDGLRDALDPTQRGVRA